MDLLRGHASFKMKKQKKILIKKLLGVSTSKAVIMENLLSALTRETMWSLQSLCTAAM